MLALVLLADWLFYGHEFGISIALFFIALACAAALANSPFASRHNVATAGSVVTVAVAPLVLSPTFFAVLLALIATAYFAVNVAAKSPRPAMASVYSAVRLLFDCGWRLLPDLFQWPWPQRNSSIGNKVMAWIVPLLFGSTFVWLFAMANPLIETWLSAVNLRELLSHIEISRVVFWLIAASLVWPFVFVRIRARAPKKAPAGPTEPRPAVLSEHLFGKPALLRALILFNVLFAVESLLDLAYLWGGVALPDGMTYATYAHRGAYPLIVTALLAAAFVIAVMQPDTEAQRSPVLRWLVYLWVAQNVLLVLSSLLRLDLYVEVYSLTYWRIAAAVWMVLVAIGLVLIMVRIAAGLSNSWLVTANLVSLAALIYLCGFVNLPRLIAEFNVTHTRELSGDGSTLDLGYLMQLGPQAIPAMDRYVAHVSPSAPPLTAERAQINRAWQALQHQERMRDWRAWTYWDWQLSQYLRQHPEAPDTGAEIADPPPAPK